MTRHNCQGDDCAYCERLAETRADAADFDLDGSMADREADRYERQMDRAWGE